MRIRNGRGRVAWKRFTVGLVQMDFRCGPVLIGRKTSLGKIFPELQNVGVAPDFNRELHNCTTPVAQHPPAKSQLPPMNLLSLLVVHAQIVLSYD